MHSRPSGDLFEPIIAAVINGLHHISQREFEMKANIPHQSCLVHRAQVWGMRDPCYSYALDDHSMLM